MILNWVSLARRYCDLLRFWSDCPDKKCRRLRHCRDRAGHCWNKRYPRYGPVRERLRARVRLKRRTLPLAMQNWQRRHDGGDALL
jgi:hypothetical protein